MKGYRKTDGSEAKLRSKSVPNIEDIKSMIRTIKKACYDNKIPMISIIQYKEKDKKTNDNQEKMYAEILSPAAVEYETKSNDTIRIFYDLENLASGRFKTVPRTKVDGEPEDYYIETDLDDNEEE